MMELNQAFFDNFRELLKDDIRSIVKEEVAGLEERISKLEAKVGGLDKRMSNLEVKVDSLDKRMSNLEVKVDSLDKRMSNLEVKVDSLDKRMSSMELRQGEMYLILKGIEEFKPTAINKLDQLQIGLGKLKNHHHQISLKTGKPVRTN